MSAKITRRGLGAATTAALAIPLAAPFIRSAEAAAPIELRCSVDTAPSHPRNVASAISWPRSRRPRTAS